MLQHGSKLLKSTTLGCHFVFQVRGAAAKTVRASIQWRWPKTENERV